MSTDPGLPPEIEIEAAFKLAMRRLAATVTIVTAGREGRRFGMTATAVTSVTAAPPTLLICVNRSASIHDIVVETGRFCVNILGTHHAGLVGPFGGGADGEARFGHGAWMDELGGMPYLDDAQANLFCEIRQNVPYRSHSVLIGEVTSVRLSDEIAPLLYQDGALAASRLLGPLIRAGSCRVISETDVKPIYIDYLNALDVEELALTDDEIIGAVEAGLAAQGRGQVVIEPRVHLMPDAAFNGHFNVLRGYVAPMNLAGVKVVGDFVDNYRQGLPSEFGVLNLFDPRTGVPRAILDATAITDMRTGAVTAVGAKHLAPPNPRVLGHIGARGTAYWNVRLLDRLFGFDEIRVHSRRPESREAFAAKLGKDLGKPVRAVDSWEECAVGADILVEASRLDAPAPLLKTAWIKPGALVVPYGTMSAVELSLTDIMDKMVVDDWGQCRSGPLGALRPHVEAGLLSEATLHAELGQIVAGSKRGREDARENILFWHRGLSLSDIALGLAMLEKGARMGIGQRLRFA